MSNTALIHPAQARLPQTYANAKTALYNCVTVDECQSWADKAAALASYAKQSQDEELMRMATRIRDRAIRRAGELLKQIAPGQGARDGKRGADAHTPLTRTEVATEAGMSKHQQVQAVRVANVPEIEFERLVESEAPPTATKLAALGTNPTQKPFVDLQGRSGTDFNKAMHFMAEFEEYARTVEAMNLEEMLPILAPKEAARVKRSIARIDAVHDKIVTRI
jgi:hypothetical protein